VGGAEAVDGGVRVEDLGVAGGAATLGVLLAGWPVVLETLRADAVGGDTAEPDEVATVPVTLVTTTEGIVAGEERLDGGVIDG
jgi:hypothetical protein